MTGEGEGFLFSPPTSFLFFCSRSNFCAITRLETLATQANDAYANFAGQTKCIMGDMQMRNRGGIDLHTTWISFVNSNV